MLRRGVAFDPSLWLQLLRWFCNGDMTFREAYELTGRVLVITATTTHPAQSPLLLSHLTAPDVVVWSAVVASASVPLLLPPVTLVKKVRDGLHGDANSGTGVRGAEDVDADLGLGAEALDGMSALSGGRLEKRNGKLWHNGAEVVSVQMNAQADAAAAPAAAAGAAADEAAGIERGVSRSLPADEDAVPEQRSLGKTLALHLAEALAPSGLSEAAVMERAVERSQASAQARVHDGERNQLSEAGASDVSVAGAAAASTHLEHVSVCGWGEGLRDGSIQSDIPVDVLRYRHNARVCVAVQVNPHVAPFMYSARGDSGRRRARWGGWRGGYVTCVLESMLRGGMYSNLNTLRELSMVPVVLGVDVTQIWTQGVGGDITITADVGLTDLSSIFNTPSEREVERKRIKGQIMVWTHLSRLEQRMRVGRALQRARERMSKLISVDHCDARGA